MDDLLIFSKSLDAIKKVKMELSQSFKMKDLGLANEILGLKIERNLYTSMIKISQEKYVREILERFSMINCKPSSTPLIPGLTINSHTEIKKRRIVNRRAYRTVN